MGVYEETVVAVDPSNVNQARSWDGPEGAYWATHADRFDRGMAAHHRAFMEAAAVSPGDHVLDIGCGSGQATRDAARRAAADGSALGVDLSSPMIDVARRIAAEEGVGNVRFLQADAQIHPFDVATFDVAISRTGSMFFGDPAVAFANVAGAVRPGGRLALLTWQALARNEWISEFAGILGGGGEPPMPPPGVPGPFSLADPDRKSVV